MDQFSHFISNHWLLCLAFIAVLSLILITELISQKKKAKELTPASVVALINKGDVVVVDLRDKNQFKTGHIIDAINASADDFQQAKMKPFKNKNLILVCEKGLHSSATAAKIQSQGFVPLVLRGGITAWQNADLPLVKETR